MYASKYIFSQTIIVKPSQIFWSQKKTEFTELPTGWISLKKDLLQCQTLHQDCLSNIKDF